MDALNVECQGVFLTKKSENCLRQTQLTSVTDENKYKRDTEYFEFFLLTAQMAGKQIHSETNVQSAASEDGKTEPPTTFSA